VTPRLTIADALRERSLETELTPTQIALRCGVSARQVRRVLRGDSAHLELVARIADVLGVRLAVVPR
jgi:transcriptional regulator with XRE-family HTH domain